MYMFEDRNDYMIYNTMVILVKHCYSVFPLLIDRVCIYAILVELGQLRRHPKFQEFAEKICYA